MQKLILGLCISLTILLTGIVPKNTLALTVDNLPIKQSSQLWTVVLGKPDSKHPNANKSPQDVFNLYSLDIKSMTNKNIKNVHIEAFRNEPNTNTMFELFTVTGKNHPKHYGTIVHRHIFPVSANSNNIEVTITWSEKGLNKKYRETFVFRQE